MAEALVQVKSEMGGDALILHTRSYHRRRWFGLRRVAIVEITAGQGLNVAGRARRKRLPPPPTNMMRTEVRGPNSTLSALGSTRQTMMLPPQADPIENSRQMPTRLPC